MKKRMQFAAVFAALAIAAPLSGCTSADPGTVSAQSYAATSKPTLSKRQSNPQIYMLRGGFGGIFSTGLDAMAKDLRAKGIPVHVQSWSTAGSVTRIIQKAYADNPGIGPIIVTGHSLGAGAVVDISRKLTSAGVPVDLAIVFDSLGASPVPKGVRKFISFKASGDRSKKGSYTAGPGFKGKLVNIDIRNLPGMAGSNHLNIVGQKALQTRVVSEIAATYKNWRRFR